MRYRAVYEKDGKRNLEYIFDAVNFDKAIVEARSWTGALQSRLTGVMPYEVEPINDDLETLLECAVRYALGRRTYVTGAISSIVCRWSPRLSDKALAIISKDISIYPEEMLGDHMDKANWHRAEASVLKEIERRRGGC